MSSGLDVKRATGLTVAESKESFTRTESVTRGSPERQAAYEAEREALLFVFLFIDLCKVWPIRQKVIT